MFVLGDLWIRPSVDRIFRQGQDLGIYLQAYHVALDNQTLKPELEVSYHLEGTRDVKLDLPDPEGRSVDYFSGRRVVLLKILRLNDLPPGRYSLVVQVRDRENLPGQGLIFRMLPLKAPSSIVLLKTASQEHLHPITGEVPFIF